MKSLSTGSEFIAPTSERAMVEAEGLGLEVVFPKEDEIQLDLDSPEDTRIFENHFDILLRYEPIVVVSRTPSRRNKGEHVTLKFYRKLSNIERICLQACLGSDRKREILSYLQEQQGDPHPTLFLEKKLTETEKGGRIGG